MFTLTHMNLYVLNGLFVQCVNQNSSCLWIYHWMILQFIHPYFRVCHKQDLTETDHKPSCRFNFKHANWTKFIKVVDAKFLGKYKDTYNRAPYFSLIWLG